LFFLKRHKKEKGLIILTFTKGGICLTKIVREVAMDMITIAVQLMEVVHMEAVRMEVVLAEMNAVVSAVTILLKKKTLHINYLRWQMKLGWKF